MAEIIELPAQSGGTPQQQLQELWRYLYRVAKDLNINFQQIGDSGLSDDEQQLMNDLTAAEKTPQEKDQEKLYSGAHNYAEAETLKSLIIKTAQFVRDEVQNWRTVLFGEESASGQFGDWTRKKGLRVDVTPDGVKQTYSYAEIVQGLRTFEINSKNYIKTGYLRTENDIPIYGVAIGKDVVTFSEDGEETYHDGNKVAELTADELSFFHNGVILAKYSGTKTSFYAGGVEVMYIQAGKIYSAVDLEIGSGKKIKIGDWQFDETGLLGEIIIGASDYYFNISNTDNIGNNYGTRIEPGNDLKIHVKYFRFGHMHETSFVFSGHRAAGFEWETNHISGATDNAASFYGLEQIGTVDDPVLAYLGRSIYASYIEPWPYQTYGYGSNYQTSNVISGSIGSSTHIWDKIYGNTIYYYGLSQLSSREYKEKIRKMEEQGAVIDRLEPVRFRYKEEPEQERLGLIYEDTVDVLPEICLEGKDGRKGINYVELIPVLLKEIKDLRARVKALEEKGD